MRREMENHGWTDVTTKYAVDWNLDRFFSNLEDDYGYSDDDGDDAYDIDNDSDFWKRVAED